MPVTPLGQNQQVEYKYFLCDLLTNRLLVEAPFRSVSYSRTLNDAGTFTGDLPVIAETENLDIYNNTLPGKTALYVVRNGVCVWGGIIWNRTYSLIDKVISISASEFTSYLSHRVVWKTWSSHYSATAVVDGGIATITLSDGIHDFDDGDAIWIDWGPDYIKYTGYFTVVSTSVVNDRTVIVTNAKYYDQSGAEKVMPKFTVGSETPITVEGRQDTYRFTTDLLKELNTDLFDFDFANDLIRPGIDVFNPVESVSRTNNIATIVLSSPHELVDGQKISISDVSTDSNFNDQVAVVASIVDSSSFTYENTGNNVSLTEENDFKSDVVSFSRANNIATHTTSGSHGFSNSDIIFVENVSETFDGYYTVYNTPTPSSFSVVRYGGDIALSYTSPLSQAQITNAIGDGSDVVFTANNEFVVGTAVVVSGISPSGFNGEYYVTARTSGTFTVDSSFAEAYVSGGTAVAEPATVTRRASVTYGTFGEHTTLGDIGIDYTDTPTSSLVYESNPVIRGYELKTVAEILEEYSTKPNGFEYRIDCEYDAAGNSFKKKFKILPLIPETIQTYLATKEKGYAGPIPASIYGADRLIFEHPGNIIEAELQETAEDSATRFFVQGRDSTLSSDASQPYSGASNHRLLNSGWAILDAVETYESDDETTLYKRAQRLLEESLPPTSTFTISVNGSAHPKLGTYSPGDWCSVKLNDNFLDQRAVNSLEQDYGTDSGSLIRKILSYSVSVPDSPSYPEEVSLELVIEPSIPISGITIVSGRAST